MRVNNNIWDFMKFIVDSRRVVFFSSYFGDDISR